MQIQMRRSVGLSELGSYVILAAGIAAFFLAPVQGQTWANRLGYPPDAKIVVFHAHDAGLCYEVNQAVEHLLEGPVVRSASTMATCPWFADCAALSQRRPGLDLGLQLTLNSELPRYRWQPAAHDSLVSSLVDDQGYLWRQVMQTTVTAKVEDVQHELEAQLRRSRAAGLEPTHFTTHLGALYSRPDLARVYLEFSRRHWIPAVVVEMTPDHIERFRREGYPLPDSMLQILADYPLPKVDDLYILPAVESYDHLKQCFFEKLEQAQPGLAQVAFAPAVESEGLQRITDDWKRRVWEFQLMTDPDVAAWLDEAGVVITDWREIMSRFQGMPIEK